MNCSSSSGTKEHIRQQSVSKLVAPRGEQATTGSWKGKAWDFIKAIPNPCYYLCKYGSLALGAAVLTGSFRSTAAVDGRRTDCLRYVGNDLSVSFHKISRLATEDRRIVYFGLRNSGLYEVPLNTTVPLKVRSQTITPLFIRALKRPSVVDLKNMTISGDIFFNKTPYTIQSVYVELDGMITRLEFAPIVPKYSAVQIDSGFAEAKVFHMTRLGNNPYDFDSHLIRSTPFARAPTEPERDWVELMQMYERYWSNSPGILCEISQQFDYCDFMDDFLECDDSPLKLAADAHFAQSLSGVTVQAWVDADPTGGTAGKQPALELVKSTRVASYPLRLTPEMLSNGLSDSPEKVSLATQNLIHEYYRNSGFTYHLAQTSQTGLDALFKSKATLEFPDYPGDHYTPADLVVHTLWLGQGKYAFHLFTAEDASDIRLRLLSTQQLKASVMVSTTRSHVVNLIFREPPKTHVYASFYSQEADQMASVVLSESTVVVAGREAVSRLSQPGTLAGMLAKDNEVVIKTDQDAWISDLILPELIDTTDRAVFVESRADRPTTIHHKRGKEDVHTGTTKGCLYLDDNWACFISFKDVDSE